MLGQYRFSVGNACLPLSSIHWEPIGAVLFAKMDQYIGIYWDWREIFDWVILGQKIIFYLTKTARIAMSTILSFVAEDIGSINS